MAGARKYDLLVKNVRVVRPNKSQVQKLDIAIAGGKFARIARAIAPGEARKVVDGRNRLAFPGLVDAHMHTGIYSPLAEDALTESRAAAQGGVTSSLNYIRSGQYYLNKGGPYAEFFPEVLEHLARALLTSTTRITSRRWTAPDRRDRRCWSSSTASPRSRSSCSTAATACTAPRATSTNS